MKFPTNLAIAASLLLFASGCAHLGDPCDDRLVSRTPSPDGSSVIAVYHRECPSKTYTMAHLEKPPGLFGTGGRRECRLMFWGGRHPVEATWKDKNNIFIATTDRLEKFDFQDSSESCGFIKISYGVQFRNERQRTDDPAVVSKIKKALSGVSQCVNDHYRAANPTNDPARYVDELIDKGEHRSAVENILGYASSAGCRVPPETYALLKELSEEFDLKPEFLESVSSPPGP
jgi:hypothetical protein